MENSHILSPPSGPVWVSLTTSLEDTSVFTNWAKCDEAGGMVIFSGQVRNHARGKAVTKLIFEGYSPMAVSEMKKIAKEAHERFSLHKIALAHVLGEMTVGKTVVFIAATATHRKEAFLACEFAIDTLKETVPIWKKEFFEDGAIWVNAHP